VLNASGVALDTGHTGFFVDPLRNQVFPNTVSYDIATKELAYFQTSAYTDFAGLVTPTLATYAPIVGAPTATLTVGSSGKVKVSLSALMGNYVAGAYYISFSATDGTTTIAAANTNSVSVQNNSAAISMARIFVVVVTSLTANASLTFTLEHAGVNGYGSNITMIVENMF